MVCRYYVQKETPKLFGEKTTLNQLNENGRRIKLQ
jgi:hypothetical protein